MFNDKISLYSIILTAPNGQPILISAVALMALVSIRGTKGGSEVTLLIRASADDLLVYSVTETPAQVFAAIQALRVRMDNDNKTAMQWRLQRATGQRPHEGHPVQGGLYEANLEDVGDIGNEDISFDPWALK